MTSKREPIKTTISAYNKCHKAKQRGHEAKRRIVDVWTFAMAPQAKTNFFEKLLQRKAFANLSAAIPNKKTDDLVAQYIHKVTAHFGEGCLNLSTIAWIIAKVEKQLASGSDSKNA
jgi:hypothetical protein